MGMLLAIMNFRFEFVFVSTFVLLWCVPDNFDTCIKIYVLLNGFGVSLE